MAAPAFVAAGNAVYGSSSAWPSSLTIGTADVPSGVIAGDRLVLTIAVEYGQRLFPTPADDTLGSFSGLSTWTSIGTANFSAGGTVSTSRTQLWAYTIRYDAALFPLTVTPIGTTSGTTYTPILSRGYYRPQLFAWRPSNAYASRGLGTSFNNATLLPSTSYGSQTLTNSDGIVVAIAHLGNGGTIGSLSTSNGFTQRATQAAITDRGGSLVVADYAPGSTGSYNGPVWTKPTPYNGAAILMSFNDPDPAVAGSNEWGVGQVRW